MSQSYDALTQKSFPEEISQCVTYLHHSLLNSFQKKELPHFSWFTPYSLRHKQQRQSPHFPQMQQARPCVLISADRLEQGKSSFLEGILTQLHDRQEKPHESCRRIGFTCAPGNISISKKPGGLKQKDIYLLSSGLCYTQYNKLSQ